MLARIAHELFWLGRDLTRAEHTARTLDGAFHADIAGAPGERGRILRDVISTEMWEALNSFYLSLGRYDLAAAMQTGPYSVYQEVKERCALFWGLVDRTMLRDDGRAFLEAGGRIEQADMVLRMLLATVPAESAHGGHESEAIALPHSVGGAQAYRRAVRDAPTVVPVVQFLLYEGAYPGSVASSVAALRDALSDADALLHRVQGELELIDRDIGTAISRSQRSPRSISSPRHDLPR